MDQLVVRVMRMRRRRANFYCCLSSTSSAMMMMMVVAVWKSCADTAAFPHAAARFDTCFMLCSFNNYCAASGAWHDDIAMIILLRLIIIGCCPPMLSMVVTKISCELFCETCGELINTSLSDTVGQETGLAGHSSRVKSEHYKKATQQDGRF